MYKLIDEDEIENEILFKKYNGNQEFIDYNKQREAALKSQYDEFL